MCCVTTRFARNFAAKLIKAFCFFFSKKKITLSLTIFSPYKSQFISFFGAIIKNSLDIFRVGDIMKVPNKLNIYRLWVYFLFLQGILIPFFNHTFIIMNLLKCEFHMVKVCYTHPVYSLFGDDLEFAFLCADSCRRTFFIFGRIRYV